MGGTLLVNTQMNGGGAPGAARPVQEADADPATGGNPAVAGQRGFGGGQSNNELRQAGTDDYQRASASMLPGQEFLMITKGTSLDCALKPRWIARFPVSRLAA